MFNHSFLKTLDILYIESDKNTRTHFSNILNKLFNSVILATTAKEGIEKFLSNKDDDFNIDIVICDITLDNDSGIEVLEKIREKDDSIPFILTAADLEMENLLKAVKFHATDFLVKPVNAKDLVFSVEKVCQVRYHKSLKSQSQQDLKDLREVINEVALVTKTDLSGNITFVNNFFCEVSGFTQEEIVGNTHSIIEDPSMNKSVNDEIAKSMEIGNIWEGKIKYISKSLEEFYVYNTIIPLFNDNNNDINEFMWVMFLATDEELEQKEFKKKVAKNIHASRRINTESRDKIDELQNRLYHYKNVDGSLIDEKRRTEKFRSQIHHYKSEVAVSEKKLKEVSDIASVKIKKVVADEKIIREKHTIASTALENVTSELNLKNKSIKELTKELEEQTRIIRKLQSDIETKEELIGL